MEIRRLCRAAGGGNVSALTNNKPTNSRPERHGVDAKSESDSWVLWGDDDNGGNGGSGGGGDHQSAAASSKYGKNQGGAEIMSLSEKLRA